ncbi:carboxymuconolactone decarboxylase family protein [Pyxidicoccus xibeiensis]|uniref:peroxidase n=1 Tax=Pyxidicoccus xibeiensis TaxID=2906759 RepID=UPI0020A77E0C|nr:peroxidase [Pyxidicoccus xibeiensis]MCP3143372.1 peroxidase [Pyxidicoccus xibeiensis]
MGSHAAVAAELLGSAEVVNAVLDDVGSAPISDAEKALFAFVDTLNHRSSEVGREDIGRLKAAGWTDEAIYDAVSVCALFNFYNRWIDGTGVQGMSAEAYQRMGKRMAPGGYAPPEPPKEPPKE